MRIILPAALSVPAILLLLACPLFAQEAVPAKDCTTIYDIELRNAQTVAPKFIEISPSDLVSLRKSFAENDVVVPESVKTVWLGETASVPGKIFIFGFDDDGCFIGRSSFDAEAYDKIFGSRS